MLLGVDTSLRPEFSQVRLRLGVQLTKTENSSKRFSCDDKVTCRACSSDKTSITGSSPQSVQACHFIGKRKKYRHSMSSHTSPVSPQQAEQAFHVTKEGKTRSACRARMRVASWKRRRGIHKTNPAHRAMRIRAAMQRKQNRDTGTRTEYRKRRGPTSPSS